MRSLRFDCLGLSPSEVGQTLFSGLSGNKMLDTIRKKRYTMLADKYIEMRAPNAGSQGALILVGTGINQSGNINFVLIRGSKIVKIWLPGSKFGNKDKVQYDNGGAQVKFFDYRVVVYAYSNFSTLQDTFTVARVNDNIKQMYFKDA